MADTTSAAPSLLPCPFCGTAPESSSCYFAFECEKCGAHGPTADSMGAEAIESWNRRAPQTVAREPMPGVKPGYSFGGRPKHAMDIDPTDFYGITDAIHHALEALAEHDDAGTDWSPLDPKRSRRLRQALMAAWVLEYPQEAATQCTIGDKT